MNKPWSLDDTLTVLRSDGLMSFDQVRKILNNKSLEAVQSFWKKFPQRAQADFNGLPYELVERFSPSCPYVYTEFNGGTRLCLWADIARHATMFPVEVRESILIMAEFQLWLHNCEENEIREVVCKRITSCLPKKKTSRKSSM